MSDFYFDSIFSSSYSKEFFNYVYIFLHITLSPSVGKIYQHDHDNEKIF